LSPDEFLLRSNGAFPRQYEPGKIQLSVPLLIRQPVPQQIDPAIHRQVSLAYAKTVAAAGEDVQFGRAIGAGPVGIKALYTARPWVSPP
jgi:hypothetical protein